MIAYIFNWGDYADNARALMESIGRYCEVHVISSSEKQYEGFRCYPPETLNYFGAHWEWVKKEFLACGEEELLIVQADVYAADADIDKFFALKDTVEWGVIAPDADFSPHRYTHICDTGVFRPVPCTDSLFFALKRAVVEIVPPATQNAYGWGIDVAACRLSRRIGLPVLKMVGILLRHPKGTGYDAEEAKRQMETYLTTIPSPIILTSHSQ